MSSSLQIHLNGEPRSAPGGSTVLDLLRQTGRDPRLVAVERNGEVVPRAEHGSVRLEEGDRLELVEFVQGG